MDYGRELICTDILGNYASWERDRPDKRPMSVTGVTVIWWSLLSGLYMARGFIAPFQQTSLTRHGSWETTRSDKHVTTTPGGVPILIIYYIIYIIYIIII